MAYVASTPGPDVRVTSLTSPSSNEGSSETSSRPEAWTDATLGGGTSCSVRISIELYLSVNVTAPSDSTRAQPSGTLTSNDSPGGVYATNTWSSGMSPGSTTSGPFGSAAPAGA